MKISNQFIYIVLALTCLQFILALLYMPINLYMLDLQIRPPVSGPHIAGPWDNDPIAISFTFAQFYFYLFGALGGSCLAGLAGGFFIHKFGSRRFYKDVVANTIPGLFSALILLNKIDRTVLLAACFVGLLSAIVLKIFGLDKNKSEYNA